MGEPSAPNPIPITNASTQPRASGPAVLSAGFRPFFLLAGLFGAITVPVWLGLYAGGLEWPLVVEPRLWHGHEMLFGYGVAAVAGFLLTVIPNWTGRQVAHEPMLAGLAVLWLLGRVAYWGQGFIAPWAVAVLDLAFLATLIGLMARVLLNPQYRRQLVFLAIVALLLVANALTHAQALGLEGTGRGDLGGRGLTLGLDAMVLLITVLGGRVVPSFTSSFLGHADPDIKIRSTPWLERAVIGLTVVLVIADQVAFDQVTAMGALAGFVALALAALNGLRLAGWQTRRTLGNPLVWVLHLGYGWLIVGLALRGLAAMGWGADWGLEPATATHAMTIGAVGTMTLAIMSRAALGHTGRALRAHPLTVAAYILVSVSALTRLSIMSWPGYGLELLMTSGLAWTAAFVCFSIVYVPILTSPRVPR